MKGFFTFRFFDNNEKDRNSLGVFCSSKADLDGLVGSIKEDVAEAFVPKSVYVIALEPLKKELIEILESSFFKREFESLVGEYDNKLKCCFVAKSGMFSNESGFRLGEEFRKDIITEGMNKIFRRRKGLIVSSPSYHFVKPSGDHCDKFIRASNLLISSAEVNFLAIALLPYINDNVLRIYIDTSSIAYLISTALQLSSIANGSEVIIESFESYAVFQEPYDFVEDRNSLVVISATTSGSMVKGLMSSSGFGRDQLITLFHLGLPEGQIGLFDVSGAVPDGVKSVRSGECGLCKRGSKLIRISGDQFLPETPKHELVVIRKPDFDKKRESFFREFATKGVLQWNKSLGNSIEHLFIDVKSIISNASDDFKRDLDKAKNKLLTRHTNTIITLDCDGSEKLGEYLSKGEGGLDIIKFSDLGDIDFDITKSVLVVAGSITSGRQLLAISRRLRELKETCIINYFVGFSKLPTDEAESQLKRDLVMGGNDFFMLRRTPIPRIKEYSKTAWDFETDFIGSYSLDDPLSECPGSLPDLFGRRTAQISAASCNGLFLPSPKLNELKLRKTFAFWSDIDIGKGANESTQSDVYWTIQVVLHDLRIRSKENGLASTYHTTLISPVCFDRYNDGVIQACILRAAKPIELNYSIDEEFSRQMTDVIISIMSNWANDHGEASLEFLLALACGRLTLVDLHVQEVVDCIDSETPEEMKFLSNAIKSSLK